MAAVSVESVSALGAGGVPVRSADPNVQARRAELVQGAQVTLVYTIVKRKDLYDVMTIIQDTYPKAFTSVEEVRSTQEGIFPARTRCFPDPLARRKG